MILNFIFWVALSSSTLQQPTVQPSPAVAAATNYNVTFSFVPSAERRPVAFDRQAGILLFRVQVQGREVWGLLDNGVQSSTIDLSLAREVGLQPTAPIGTLETATGSVERRRVFGVDVVIPGQVRYRTPLSAVDLSRISSVLGRPIGLVIGREIFKNMTFVVHPARGTFELGVSGRVQVSDVVPYMTLLDDDAHAVASIGGRSVTLMVDLGYNGHISLTPEAWTRSDLDRIPFENERGADMIGNRVDQRRATIPQISIGPFARENVRAVRRPALAVNRDGLIGFGFLSGFDFAIDVKSRRLWLLRDLTVNPPAANSTSPSIH